MAAANCDRNGPRIEANQVDTLARAPVGLVDPRKGRQIQSGLVRPSLVILIFMQKLKLEGTPPAAGRAKR